ncbi:hypothetical protein GFC29_608 [Anoxybacillus sp. B7M1]|jgi:hypothetical protein|uniref:Uncharacterized protein n=1 Tax=Anoxybacteroides rupiense TaxID=311460 RepID=A0ABD5ITN8_9BACL|nr:MULTISPECIES: hypothetical protein [Anoxybacillus]ANB57824.1 hypothetical protein GFC28_1019 [Anoxybacillus sp. B2M1]ANB65118.1 hypothetical protein GFC29_608 [Anoxybacillus sp. B7M1]KXG10757.1 hypothetical protein AT864_01348 [Anoxybacillus sp. P3H1B]MBB3905951.1 hypothetical protein [Anoxybacillus rupiensis]MBS2772191.1 hypothetical protein [Anoxybacillus rupiensis]
MNQPQFKYEQRTFKHLFEMSETLLHEANEQLIRIDIGQLPNDVDARNYVKFRLMHLQRSFGESVPIEFRSTYNSLWSQLYRLEHQADYRHPYIQQLLTHIMSDDQDHRKNYRK